MSTPNLPASVRARLRNLARTQPGDFNALLSRYAVERLLYRLSRSPHARRFVLKGAMLFMPWLGQPLRPTRDLDLLFQGEALAPGDPSPAVLQALFAQICGQEVAADGLVFDPASIRTQEIRERQRYQGVRVRLVATLGSARIDLQVDVGFGDVVTPPAQLVDYPTLLNFPAPRLYAYPREVVIAEKLESMVILGMVNSRMKDFYDIWVLACHFDFHATTLAGAIRATFARRRTPLPRELPVALTAQFSQDEGKAQQWVAFLRRQELDAPTLEQVVAEVADFLQPVLRAAAGASTDSRHWPPGGPWAA